MIKKIIYCSFVFFMACQSLESPEKPKNLISEEKMVEILTDIAFVKAATSSYKKIFNKEKISPEAYILQKHNIDSLVFAQNNKWYTNQIEKYQEIFSKVKKNLGDSKEKFKKQKKIEDSIKKIEDSINKSKDLKKNKIKDLNQLFIKDKNKAKYKVDKKVKNKKKLKNLILDKKKKSQ